MAARIRQGGYYTDGHDLVEIGKVRMAAPCVEFYEVVSERLRCLGVLEFRERFWLVKDANTT